MTREVDPSRRKRPLDGADRVRQAAQAMKSRPLKRDADRYQRSNQETP